MHSSYSNLQRRAMIVAVADIVFGLVCIAAGTYCLIHGFLFQRPYTESYSMKIVGFIVLPLSVVSVPTGVLLVIGVAKSVRALIVVWMVKACLLAVFLFPVGTVFYLPLLPIILRLHREMSSSQEAGISQPDVDRDLDLPYSAFYDTCEASGEQHA